MFKLLSFFLLFHLNTVAQKSKGVTNSKDTLTMLFGLQIKYWDKIDNPPFYGKTKVINEGWCLQKKQSSLLKYKYSKSDIKKRYEPIEIDLLIGKLNIQLKNDTIIISQLDSKILIKKITNDTLIVHDINGGFIGDAIFIRSKDQRRKIIPALKDKRDKASASTRGAYNKSTSKIWAGRKLCRNF